MPDDADPVTGLGDQPSQRTFTDDDALEVVDANASCSNCAHFEVCALRNRFEAVVMEAVNTPEDPPMVPDELARICDEYSPVEDA